MTGYLDRIRGGVGIVEEPTFLLRDLYAVDSATINQGHPPAVREPPVATDTVPTLIDRPANNVELTTSGLELTAFLPEIVPLRTRIAVQGAWSRSRLISDGLEFGTRFDEFQLDGRQSRAPYWEGTVRTGNQLLVTGRVIHHRPRIGLVVTATIQAFLHETQQTQAGVDTLAFAGYITRGGELVPVAPEQRAQPQYADLRLPRIGILVEPRRGAVTWLMSLQVTKTLPLGGRFSFYAFNALDRQGKFGSLTVTQRLFEPVRFGVELSMPLGLAWGER